MEKKHMHRIFLVAGARPNFMKIAPLWKALKRYKKITCRIIHTGQHYDANLSAVFFKTFRLPRPHINLGVCKGSRKKQISAVQQRFVTVCQKEKPCLVVVVGDVNSTLGAARGAHKCQVPVAHVEAGLRSFDRMMPEEHNRIATDRISKYLFASEQSGVKNLLHEGAERRNIFFTGNVMIDTLIQQLPSIRTSKILHRLSLTRKHYVVLTAHRPSNVDTKRQLQRTLSFISWLAAQQPVVFPLHPRTKKSFVRHNLFSHLQKVNNLIITQPLGYHDFLCLVLNSAFVVTDSGGIQEETTYLNVPCFTLRNNTERPSTITQGTNILLGTDLLVAKKRLLQTLQQKRQKCTIPSRWDGKSAVRIASVLIKVLAHEVNGHGV